MSTGTWWVKCIVLRSGPQPSGFPPRKRSAGGYQCPVVQSSGSQNCVQKNHLEGLLKHRLLSLLPILDSIGLKCAEDLHWKRWGFPSKAHTVDGGHTLRALLLRKRKTLKVTRRPPVSPKVCKLCVCVCVCVCVYVFGGIVEGLKVRVCIFGREIRISANHKELLIPQSSG